jgi:hypothetical protein
MTRNPYKPPDAPVERAAEADGDPTTASMPLYTTTQMAVGAFLGTAMAGAWFAAANFRAVDQPGRARSCLWLGLAATLVTFAIAFALPDGFPNSVLPLAVAIGVRGLAEPRFAAILREHQQSGGDLRSWWRVVGISLQWCVAAVAVLGVGIAAYSLILGDAEAAIHSPT